MSRHEYIHPTLRGIVNAIAPAITEPYTPICDAGSGAPAGATASERDDSPQMAHDGCVCVTSPSPTAGPAAIHRRATSSKGLRNPAQHDYQRLVEDIATDPPRDGFATTVDLPDLADAQCALVLRVNADVADGMELVAAELADIYAQPDATLTGLYTRLGRYLDERLRPHVKRYLLEDVQAECVQDESHRRADECEALDNAAGSAAARNSLR